MLDERNQQNKQKEYDQEYTLWVHNFALWKEIHGGEVPSDEAEAIPIMSDELGAVDKFLKEIDNKKKVANKELNKWTEWM